MEKSFIDWLSTLVTLYLVVLSLKHIGSVTWCYFTQVILSVKVLLIGLNVWPHDWNGSGSIVMRQS